ncbi:MAG: hypothetical protein AAGH83_05350 [Pseudomonadota bacterium]
MPIVIIGFIIVFVLMYVIWKAQGDRRECRWRENHAKDTDAGRYFICMSCGAEAIRADKKEPAQCLRPE